MLRARRQLAWLLVLAVLLAVLASALGRAAQAGDEEQPTIATVRARAPDVAAGEHLYAICAACHGTLGGGRAAGEIPAIAGQHPGVLIRQLVAYRNGVRWDVRMEHAAQIRRLGDAQAIADVIAYVSRLPTPTTNQRGVGRNLAIGATLYDRRCRSCHGAAGEGSAVRDVPRLAAQHYGYLQRQFFDVLEHRRPELEASHAVAMRGLDRDEIDGIADRLSRFEPAKN